MPHVNKIVLPEGSCTPMQRWNARSSSVIERIGWGTVLTQNFEVGMLSRAGFTAAAAAPQPKLLCSDHDSSTHDSAPERGGVGGGLSDSFRCLHTHSKSG